jgi:hypothetical protein
VSDPEEPGQDRRFIREEANAMLPELREWLARMRESRQVMLRSGERVRASVAGNGGGPEGQEYTEATRILKEGVERLSAQGIVLRDVEAGLVDFPAEREGRLVFLCWRLGEDDVAYWHDVDTGFPGRQPLD